MIRRSPYHRNIKTNKRLHFEITTRGKINGNTNIRSLLDTIEDNLLFEKDPNIKDIPPASICKRVATKKKEGTIP